MFYRTSWRNSNPASSVPLADAMTTAPRHQWTIFKGDTSGAFIYPIGTTNQNAVFRVARWYIFKPKIPI
jgi:hypothetical protein